MFACVRVCVCVAVCVSGDVCGGKKVAKTVCLFLGVIKWGRFHEHASYTQLAFWQRFFLPVLCAHLDRFSIFAVFFWRFFLSLILSLTLSFLVTSSARLYFPRRKSEADRYWCRFWWGLCKIVVRFSCLIYRKKSIFSENIYFSCSSQLLHLFVCVSLSQPQKKRSEALVDDDGVVVFSKYVYFEPKLHTLSIHSKCAQQWYDFE